MPCEELQRLREQATALKNRIHDQRLKARAAENTRADRPSGASEYLPLLRRKLERLSDGIDRHIAKHHCQE